MPDFTGGQFPSLDGNTEAEVAQRTEPDTDGNWFRKVFTVHNRHHTRGLPTDHPHHVVNFGAVLQAALQQGLHPKSAPELESEDEHPSDPSSTNLTYRVQVVPSVSDEHPETTVTPSNLAAALDNGGAVPLPEPVPVEPAVGANTAPSTREQDATFPPAQGEAGAGGVAPTGSTPEPPVTEPTPETPAAPAETAPPPAE